ncbi:MAG: hypothetical protein MJZ29_09820 [Bacteroidaceae bacterium]|nr:hypothetical protein [Bacteroidaceae bacterium]
MTRTKQKVVDTELYIATTYNDMEDTQVLIGVYASKEIAHRELLKSLVDYIDEVDGELVDGFIEDGELETIDGYIHFDKKSIEGEPKTIRLLANYYVDHFSLNYYKLFSGKRALNNICKKMATAEINEDEYDTAAEYRKAINAKAREISQILETRGYSYEPMFGDVQSIYISNTVKVMTK